MYNWNKLKRKEDIPKKLVGKACSVILLLEHGEVLIPVQQNPSMQPA